MKKEITKTITFHNALNYGAILQTIGLQKAIQNLNYENYVINYTDKCMNQYDPLNFKDLHFLDIIKKIARFILYGRRLTKRRKSFISFINDNITLTKELNNIEEIINDIQDNDILITGSDQVWSTEILNGLSDIYTLNFNNINNKKISYAASIGNSKIDKKYIQDFQNKISKINYISVREDSLKKELEKILENKRINVVLDPTMLLTKEQWMNLTDNYNDEIKEEYIVAYTLDVNPEYIKIVNELSEKTGLRIIYFDYRNYGFKNVLKNCYSENPYAFINYIKNAKYVVTTSFHGMVFSIIFNKNFWAIPHRTRGARMIDLLRKLELNDRMITTLKEFQEKKYDKNILYENVNKKLKKERDLSIEWLVNAIKK